MGAFVALIPITIALIIGSIIFLIGVILLSVFIVMIKKKKIKKGFIAIPIILILFGGVLTYPGLSLIIEGVKEWNSLGIQKKDSPLVYAVLNESDKKVELLLKKGANPNEENYYSALTAACYNNNFNKAKILIEYGADVNLSDGSGKTPLYTILNGNLKEDSIKTLELLIEKDVDINQKFEHGATPLMLAVSRSGYKDYPSIKVLKNLVMLLIEKGAKIDVTDDYGKTPLMWACSGGFNNDIITLLLQKGADKNALSAEKCTALDYLKKMYEHDKNNPVKDYTTEKGYEENYQKAVLLLS